MGNLVMSYGRHEWVVTKHLLSGRALIKCQYCRDWAYADAEPVPWAECDALR